MLDTWGQNHFRVDFPFSQWSGLLETKGKYPVNIGHIHFPYSPCPPMTHAVSPLDVQWAQSLSFMHSVNIFWVSTVIRLYKGAGETGVSHSHSLSLQKWEKLRVPWGSVGQGIFFADVVVKLKPSWRGWPGERKGKLNSRTKKQITWKERINKWSGNRILTAFLSANLSVSGDWVWVPRGGETSRLMCHVYHLKFGF